MLSLDSLPPEMICEIIGFRDGCPVADINVVQSLLCMSRYFRSVIRSCGIQHLVSDHPVIYPIENFVGLTDLKTVGDNIILTLVPNGMDTLKQIWNLFPKLYKANIDIGQYVNQTHLQEIVKSGYFLISQIPNPNFRLFAETDNVSLPEKHLLVFQHDRIMMINAIPWLIYDLMMDYQNLVYYSTGPLFGVMIYAWSNNEDIRNRIDGITHAGTGYRVMLSNLRRFLSEANFGLPDLDNPSIEIFTSRLANQGYADVDTISRLIDIYLGREDINQPLSQYFGTWTSGPNIFETFTINDEMIDLSHIYLYDIPPGPNLSEIDNRLIRDAILNVKIN